MLSYSTKCKNLVFYYFIWHFIKYLSIQWS